MVKVKEDITGWVMAEHGYPESKLTVIKQVDDYVDNKGNKQARWLCECSCPEHNRIIVIGNHLKRKEGYTKSCGCLTREKSIKCNAGNKKLNKYDLSGEYGIGWTTNTNKEFYFDLEDYDKIKDYTWQEAIVKHRGSYLTAWGENGKTLKFHQIVYQAYCDHKNKNGLDNRKENLRPCTPSQNSMNKKIQSNNTSGITGVYWSKKDNAWTAGVRKNGKYIYLGFFHNKEDAIKARLKGEKEYFGDFAPQKHLYEQYGIE